MKTSVMLLWACTKTNDIEIAEVAFDILQHMARSSPDGIPLEAFEKGLHVCSNLSYYEEAVFLLEAFR